MAEAVTPALCLDQISAGKPADPADGAVNGADDMSRIHMPGPGLGFQLAREKIIEGDIVRGPFLQGLKRLRARRYMSLDRPCCGRIYCGQTLIASSRRTGCDLVC